MTENRLRDLLHESVDDLPTVPLAERAWQDGARRRRRHTAATAVGAVASVAVVLGSFSLLGGGGSDDRGGSPAGTPETSASATPTPAPTTPPPVSLKPDATHRGWDVFWGPTPGQEQEMPWTDSVLPRQVDLSAAADDLAAAPIDRALAAWAVVGEDNALDRVVVMAPDQSLRTVDVSGLAPLRDAGGNFLVPARGSMLSPDGTHLAFPQPGEVRVLALATGEWSTVDTGQATTEWLEWASTDTLWLPRTPDRKDGPLFGIDAPGGGSLGSMQFAGAPALGGAPYGRLVSGDHGPAFSLEGVAGLPVAEDEVTPSHVIVVDGTERRSVLVLSASERSGSREKQCCAAQAWLDEDRLVYETRDAGALTVWAWWVGSHEFARLAEVTGGGGTVVSSYADLSR